MRESKPASVITRGWSNPCRPARPFKRLSLVYVPLVNPVAYWIAPRRDKQTKENLWARVFAVLRETALTEIVLLCSLEVQSRHVIEHHTYSTAANFLCVGIGYAFHVVLYIIVTRLDNFAGSVFLTVIVFAETKVIARASVLP